MPYLKIKTANGTGNDWTTINDLTLNELTVVDNLYIGDETFEEKFNTQIKSIKDEVDDKIDEVNAALAALEDGGTSFTVYGGDTGPTIEAAKGKFAIQITTTGNYSILWYSKPNRINNPTSYTWARVNAIWG